MEGDSPLMHKERQNPSSSWGNVEKKHLVTLLHLHTDSPDARRKAWSEEAWVKISEGMHSRFPELNFSMKQLKQLERNLRDSYRLVKEIDGLEALYEGGSLEPNATNKRRKLREPAALALIAINNEDGNNEDGEPAANTNPGQDDGKNKDDESSTHVTNNPFEDMLRRKKEKVRCMREALDIEKEEFRLQQEYHELQSQKRQHYLDNLEEQNLQQQEYQQYDQEQNLQQEEYQQYQEQNLQQEYQQYQEPVNLQPNNQQQYQRWSSYTTYTSTNIAATDAPACAEQNVILNRCMLKLRSVMPGLTKREFMIYWEVLRDPFRQQVFLYFDNALAKQYIEAWVLFFENNGKLCF